MKAQQKTKATQQKLALKKNKQDNWTQDEHNKFIEAVRRYGKNWSAITDFVATKSKKSVLYHSRTFISQVAKNPNLEDSDVILALKVQGKRGRPKIKRSE